MHTQKEILEELMDSPFGNISEIFLVTAIQRYCERILTGTEEYSDLVPRTEWNEVAAWTLKQIISKSV